MTSLRTITVQSLGEFIDKVTPPCRDKASGRHRNYTIYRGVASNHSSLLTSLDRLGGIDPPHTKVHLEEHILRNFTRYGRPFISPAATVWEMLVTAQHHGVPTRLLDWTYSPLVAAHFASLAAGRTKERVIWQLDWRTIHEHFGLKPLAFLVSDLDEAIREKGFGSAWDFLNSKSSEKPFICMLEPPALNDRIVAQSAAFTLCSDKTKSIDRILEENRLSDCLKKFVIQEDRADLFRDQLDLCAIDERRLFPGLDGIASEISRYYSAGSEET
jgi:hypothetical protein